MEWLSTDRDGEPMAGLFDAVPVGLAVIDPRQPGNPIVRINAEFTALTGYGPEEALGSPLSMLHGVGTGPTAVPLDAALAGGRPGATELLTYRKDGGPSWLRMEVRPLPGPDGAPRLLVVGLCDVTERHLAEQALRDTNQRLRAATEAVPLPTLHLRLDGSVTEANALAHDLFGVRGSAGVGLSGRNIAEFATTGDDGFPRLLGWMRDAVPAERVEIRARREDGAALWVSASGRPFTTQGEMRYLLSLLDITELKRREQELTAANEEAERTIRARMRFLAAASHDLRQPLQALALFTSALDNHVRGPQGHTVVASMKASLRGMEEMFDALLDMSRLDAGVTTAEPCEFLINDILERLEAEHGPQAAAAGLELRVVPSSAAVRSDPRLLARILGNFLSNAIRYTRSGRIVVGCLHRGRSLRLMVADTGRGIAESQRLEIFREFRQVGLPAMSGRGQGIGLGLAIVQRLARLLGHRLDLRSVEGRGSAFSVDVPLAEDIVPNASDMDENARDDDAPAVDGATVVVVDDDPDIRDALSMLLSQWGCRAVVATNADHAIDELRRLGARPDVVLADLHLGTHGSGPAAIAAIREEMRSSAPALLFSGDTEAAGAPGPAPFRLLRKPIEPTRLRAELAAALGR